MQRLTYHTTIILLSCFLLTGCFNNLWTGASLVYGRHTTYRKVDDFQLNASANRALYRDKVFKQNNIHIEITVFNRDVLMVGYVPDAEHRQEAYARVDTATAGKRRFFDQVIVGRIPNDAVQDSWITAKIRSRIIADSDINPDSFKIVTFGHVVYLLGDVIPVQANKVIHFARSCIGVKRVVKLFRYYNLSDRPI